MAYKRKHGEEIMDIKFKDKESIPQEHTVSTFKSGEEMPVTKVNGFYKVENVEGVFTCRVYAEQAYREYLRSIEVPKLDKEIKQVSKRVRYGMGKQKDIDKAIEKKQEWLETH